MREDPIADADVTLVVTAVDEEGVSGLESELASIGEDIERLQYGAVQITVSQEQIDEVCSLDGIESIETADAVGIGGDAGEDL